MKQRWLISALALLAVVLSTGIVQAQSANRGRSNFDWIVARAITVTADLIVSDDATVTDDLTVAGDTALSGATTLGGAVTQSDGNLTVADDLFQANYIHGGNQRHHHAHRQLPGDYCLCCQGRGYDCRRCSG
jgi:hypothetical protein